MKEYKKALKNLNEAKKNQKSFSKLLKITTQSNLTKNLIVASKIQKFNEITESFKLPDSVTKMIEQNNRLLNLTPKASQLSSLQKFNAITESFKLPDSVTKMIEQNNRLLNLTPKASQLSSLQKFNAITESFKLPDSVTKMIEQNNRLLNLTPKASQLSSLQKFNAITESFKLPDSVTKIIEQNNRLLNLTPKASRLSSFHSLNKTFESITHSRDIIKILEEEIDNVVLNDQANTHSNEEIATSVDKILKESGLVDNLNKLTNASDNQNDQIDELTESVNKIYEALESQPTGIKKVMYYIMNTWIQPIILSLIVGIISPTPLVTELNANIWEQKNTIKEINLEKAYVKATNLNIRNDSSINGIVVGKFKKNTVIQPITEVNGWILIEYVGKGVPPTKEFGWVNKKYLTYFN